jgi:hypothetical protein
VGRALDLRELPPYAVVDQDREGVPAMLVLLDDKGEAQEIAIEGAEPVRGSRSSRCRLRLGGTGGRGYAALGGMKSRFLASDYCSSQV